MTNIINFKIFTLFPEIFPGYLSHSIMGNALKNNIWSFSAINIRDYAYNKNKNVDDYPYGGGAGMVIRPDAIADAIDANIVNKQCKIIYFSPRGRPLKQDRVLELSEEKELALICGRYEGIDQRVIEEYEMEEISIGDYVLSCGELPAMVLMDAVLRNIKGVVGDKLSLDEESFGSGKNSKYHNLLEYPHYTKPADWRGRKVPDVLLSGHHQKIANWRLNEAKKITGARRSDLIKDIDY